MRESIDKFIKRCLESRWYLIAFFQREKALELLKIQKQKIKIKQVINKPDIIIYSDRKHLSASGLNPTESSRGRRMNKTQTLSWRKSWFS